MEEIKIREVRPEDAAEISAIYAPYVENTAITFEYEVPDAAAFEARIRRTLEKYPYIAAVDGAGRIVGYAYASAFKERAAYARSVELSIYVEMGHRSMGIGKKLYAVLENCLRAQNVLNANACITCPKPGVRDPHLDDTSPRFHERLGYRTVGVFHDCGWKFSTWYDMMWMEKMLGAHTLEEKDFIAFPKIDKSGLFK